MRISLPVVAVCAAAMFVTAPEPANSQQSAPPAIAAYRPGLGDLMTMTVQPRHTKLGLAGASGNWTYAAYALHELEESFERAAKIWPKYRTYAIPDMLESVAREPMTAVADAIKARDSARFTAAYAQLTASCNTCHQSTERGFVVIQAPAGSAFPNQDFQPRK